MPIYWTFIRLLTVPQSPKELRIRLAGFQKSRSWLAWKLCMFACRPGIKLPVDCTQYRITRVLVFALALRTDRNCRGLCKSASFTCTSQRLFPDRKFISRFASAAGHLRWRWIGQLKNLNCRGSA
eukprot:256330-Amphidinium_carterae.1